MESLRVDIGNYIAEQGNTLSFEDIRGWVLRTMFSMLASKFLSAAEVDEMKKFQSGVLDLIMRSHALPGDQDLLKEKASYLHDLMERLNIDDDKASAVLDLLIFAGMILSSSLNVCVTILCCRNDFFDPNTYKVGEHNIMQFVWEYLRLFPPHSSVGWREDDLQHVAVIGMTGRDKSLWGDDIDTFRPDRCTAEEFAAKSCFFAKPAGIYSCPGKTFALESMSAFLLELLATGPWSCPKNVKSYPALPYFDPVELKRLPSVIVVGGGASGLICALKLAERGIKVTVIEKNTIIGGHARHAEVLGGHLRNPAFGFFSDGVYPNFVSLIGDLGVDKVPLCKVHDFHQSIASDGHQIPEQHRDEVLRFLKGMRSIYDSGGGGLETIGEYLDAHGYDEDFIIYVILGEVIKFFAGLSVQEFLHIPLDLMAWWSISEFLQADLFRLRNKDYMEAFAAKLKEHGVEILTSASPQLLSRDRNG